MQCLAAPCQELLTSSWGLQQVKRPQLAPPGHLLAAATSRSAQRGRRRHGGGTRQSCHESQLGTTVPVLLPWLLVQDGSASDTSHPCFCMALIHLQTLSNLPSYILHFSSVRRKTVQEQLSLILRPGGASWVVPEAR